MAMPVPSPSDIEQQKIADCLASIDELVALHTLKLDALKNHKKGLQQQLFPADGETVPKLRFHEFKGNKDWQKTAFGKIATFMNGRAYKQEELLEQGKYRVLRVGNFFTSKDWYFSDLELDRTKYCIDGDLLYAWSASFGPRIWKGEKVIYHYHIWKVVATKGIDKQFLYRLLDYETERMKSNQANGLGIMHITKGAIEAWECSIPSLEEQKKIADYLSSLDELVLTQESKVGELLKQKKGLIQKLFPMMDDNI
jgi:type I restriction enzyme S subunit